MKKGIFLYGLLLGGLIALLKLIEYKFWIRDHSMELYIGLIAVLFTGLGVWSGLKLVKPKTEIKEVLIEKTILVSVPSSVSETKDPVPFEAKEETLKAYGISKREYHVLELMAEGLSNQEIADRLFVSLNTIKTHSSNLFDKLEVNRRMQAIQKAKELSLLP